MNQKTDFFSEEELAQLPKHIAIVMDGNGRWAKKRLLPRTIGHRKGVDTVKKAIQLCSKYGIQYLSLFVFSTENWQRPKTEVNHLISLFIRSLESETPLLMENQVRLRVIGDLAPFPDELQQLILSVEQQTKNNEKLTLTLFANYGGRWDIIQAIKKLLLDGVSNEQIDENIFASYLTSSDIPDPDLLIRTSGEKRISNFFLWQLAYTELFFCNTLWPDFSEKDFVSALKSFLQRERRFGSAKDTQTTK